MPGLGHDRDLTVEEVRYRIRSFAPDEFRSPLCFARCWTSVRKAKEGEVKGDIFAFLTSERTPRSAMPPGKNIARVQPDQVTAANAVLSRLTEASTPTQTAKDLS
jgi:hypothetical protein